MYIRISEIPREGLDVVAGRGRGWIPKLLEGMNPYPLRTCRVESVRLVLSVEGRDLLAEGAFVAVAEGECDRCTGEVRVRLEKEFHTVLVPRDRGPADRGVELKEDDLDIGFYDGGGIEVADIFWEQVALALPRKVLCRDDCRGVCPRCGADRNQEACDCPEEAVPTPFGVLEKLTWKKE